MKAPLVRLGLALALLASGAAAAEPVAVRFREGLVHGFLVLRTLDGTTLGDGDLLQVAEGDEVTSRLVFHFGDGSLHDEQTVFSQQGSFRFVSHHLVQKGPAFERSIDATIDGKSGRVLVRATDKGGKERVYDEHFDLPPELANGVILTALKNIAPETPRTTLPMLALTPKPRLVQLEITPAGEESFQIAGATRKATHYVVKVDIGGVTGLLASLVGKTPPDSHVWILGGTAPAFVKSESPFFPGAPLWRIELAGPTWPRPR